MHDDTAPNGYTPTVRLMVVMQEYFLDKFQCGYQILLLMNLSYASILTVKLLLNLNWFFMPIRSIAWYLMQEAMRKSDAPVHVKYLQTLVECLSMLGKVSAAGAIIWYAVKFESHRI